MRKYLVALVAVVLVLAGALVALLGPRHCPVNREALGRIAEGMSRAEVHALLGVPPGDYRTQPHGPSNLIVALDGGGPRSMGDGLMTIGAVEEWEGDEGTLEVHFDPLDGKVAGARFLDAESHACGLVELARWRLGKLGSRLP